MSHTHHSGRVLPTMQILSWAARPASKSQVAMLAAPS